MKNSIFNLLLKKEFMAKILKMKNREEIRQAFFKEGLELTEEELNSVIKTLKDMSNGLDKYSEEKIKELSEIVKNLDPRVLDVAAGGDPPTPVSDNEVKAKKFEADIASKENATAWVQLAGTLATVGGNVYTVYQQNKPQPEKPVDKYVVLGGNGKKGSGNGTYIAAAAVCGVTLLGIAALYRNEIKSWLSGGKKS